MLPHPGWARPVRRRAPLWEDGRGEVCRGRVNPDIAPLSGTYIKDTPRDDYTELLDSIKTNGLEKPIILRNAGGGTYQLVDAGASP